MKRPDFKYDLHANGHLQNLTGVPFLGGELHDKDVHVGHLQPHVETFALDSSESVNVLISYSSHCWTCKEADAVDEWRHIMIWDHKRLRRYEPSRHETSLHLPALMRQLAFNKIYVTPSDRNYGCYNATLKDIHGHAYTAYFTVKKDKGKFDGIRHAFRIYVESAYAKAQPEDGSKTSFRAIIGQARVGKTVKYRRR